MALLFAEHFDGYTDTTNYRIAVENTTDGASYNATGGRFGGGAIENTSLATGDVRLLKAVPASNMIRLAFHIFCARNASTTGNRDIIRLFDSGSTRFWRLIGTAAAEFISRLAPTRYDDVNPPAANIVTPVYSPPWNDGVWHHIEIELKAHITTGSFKMKMDGVELTEYTIASGDTSDAASGDVTSFDRIMFAGACNNTSSVQGLLIDDLIVWDDSGSEFTGALAAEHRLRKVDPTGNGAGGQQWTPSAGFNYACVDEANFNSDTDYVSDTVAGHIDYYGISALGWTPVAIKAVIVESIGKMDTGVHTWRNRLLSSAAPFSGTSKTATTTYRKSWDFVTFDPNTSAAWTKANLEAAQFGVEFVS